VSSDRLDTRLLEGEGAGFSSLVGHGYAGMLAHMLGPRGDEEGHGVQQKDGCRPSA
jgi:hypothetical protein